MHQQQRHVSLICAFVKFMVVYKTENVLLLKLNRWIKVFKKLTVTQLVNELLPVFYETPRFIVVCFFQTTQSPAYEYSWHLRKYSKLSLIRLQLTWMSDSPDRNMKNEKLCSQLSTYFKRHMAFRSKRAFRLCWGHLERLKPYKKISKIGLSWISASDRGRNCCSHIFLFIFTSTTCKKKVKFSLCLTN
jgi:hypothetical protein